MSKSLAPQIIRGVAASTVAFGAAVGLYYLYKFSQHDRDVRNLIANCIKEQKVTIDVEIPKDGVGGLIGRSGNNIKEIQDKTDTKITFKDDVPDAKVRVCQIKGYETNAKAARDIIIEFLASQPKIVTEKMTVDQRVCGRIIGRGGTTIRSMQTNSGAKIMLEGSNAETADDPKRVIIIRGTEVQVKVAKGLIEEKVEEDAENRRIAACTSMRSTRSPRRTLVNVDEAENTVDGRVSSRRNLEQLPGIQEGFIEVMVSAMKHPGRFWIQSVGSPSNQLDRLVEKMTEFYNQEENRSIFKPKQLLEQGDLVATQFERDNKWYRGMVRDIKVNEEDFNKSLVDIYYVDYGDDEEKTQDLLCQLKVEFLNLRHQAIECCLAGVQPASDDGLWSEDASDLFDELSQASCWVPVMAKVRGYRLQARGDRGNSPVPMLEIISNDTNIASELITKGFATKVEAETNGCATNGAPAIEENTRKTRGIPAGEERWDDDSDLDM